MIHITDRIDGLINALLCTFYQCLRHFFPVKKENFRNCFNHIQRMKLAAFLIPCSLAVYPFGYLAQNCVNPLCLECQKTKMVGAVKYTAIEYQNLREKGVSAITTALKDMAFFNGEDRTHFLKRKQIHIFRDEINF